jgi:hypothetical protein
VVHIRTRGGGFDNRGGPCQPSWDPNNELDPTDPQYWPQVLYGPWTTDKDALGLLHRHQFVRRGAHPIARRRIPGAAALLPAELAQHEDPVAGGLLRGVLAGRDVKKGGRRRAWLEAIPEALVKLARAPSAAGVLDLRRGR